VSIVSPFLLFLLHFCLAEHGEIAFVSISLFGWKHTGSLYTSTIAWNVNEVEKRVHQLLFENQMSIWLSCGAGGVSLCKKGM